MATFFASVGGVKIKYVEGDTPANMEPRTVVQITSTGETDEHALADALASLNGRRVKVSIMLDQGELV